MNENTQYGEKFSIYFKFIDDIFKKSDVFEANVTDSTGKLTKFKSIYPDKTEYKKLEIPDSAGTIILDIIILRTDNAEQIAKGKVTIKYDDILDELTVTPLKFNEKKRGISIWLKKDEKTNSYFTFEISRGENSSVAG
ncbi:hypothetical protein QE177_14580 (plasmid) [Arsenophonus sp. aPb]|uniref:hypothetical protein n=1 Tax=Arsenophonus sp. aPb TaxID=3041619 RepID=UPI002469BAA0|nr:hypothetical protein [Arsenophonus sp. aPb]WGL99807.1 hypothetical protein QE177_14580 [Arsenophonus sp. aPb]